MEDDPKTDERLGNSEDISSSPFGVLFPAVPALTGSGRFEVLAGKGCSES